MTDRRGVILVALSALGFGFMALFKSWTVPANPATPVGTETLLALRFTIGSLILFAIGAARSERPPRGRMLLLLFGMGSVLYFGEAVCYFYAIDAGAPSGLVSLLLYLYPGIVALLSWAFLRHHLSRAMLAALALGLVGSALTIGPLGSSPPLGIALGLGTALSYAVYILVGARLPLDLPKISAAAIVTGGAALSFWILSLVRGVHMPADSRAWAGVLGLALVSTVISITALLAGIARIGAVRASTLSIIEPATTVLVGWIFLAEELTPLRTAGALLIMSAAVIAARAK